MILYNLFLVVNNIHEVILMSNQRNKKETGKNIKFHEKIPINEIFYYFSYFALSGVYYGNLYY